MQIHKLPATKAETVQPDAKALGEATTRYVSDATYPPLELVNKPNVTTAEAAYYLNRRPQTLRIWAMNQHPIRPFNIHGRLAWPVTELKRLLGVPA